MALDFARLKHIDQTSISLVTGYTKELTTSSNHICPQGIINIIVLFTKILERFTKGNNAIEISSQNDIVGINDLATINQQDIVFYTCDWCAIYGELDIDCNDKRTQSCIY